MITTWLNLMIEFAAIQIQFLGQFHELRNLQREKVTSLHTQWTF